MTISKKGFLMSKAFLSLIISLVILGACGCEPAPEPDFVIGTRPLIKVKPVKTYTAGHSVEGRPIECSVLGGGEDIVMLIATIHGNESAGTPIARRMIQFIRDSDDMLAQHKIVIMPMVNPDGFYHNKRYNANDVDLNRNFVAFNRVNNKRNGPHGLSEPESRVIQETILKYKPNRIIVFHEPLACIDYDGPGGDIAKAMGKHTDLPVKKLGSRPGSLGSYAGETLGIPIICVELTPKAKKLSADQLWAKYSKMTMAAIRYNAK